MNSTHSSLSSAILGIGGYSPERIVKNADLEPVLETTDDWIVQRTGIHERRWARPDQATSDLCLEASMAALKDAKMETSHIDCIIVATSTPDFDIPGTATILGKKLNLAGLPTFEIRQACSGFLYGLQMADSFIRSGVYKHILLVGAEVQSKVLDMSPRGRSVTVIFADGAGAALIGASQNTNSRILATQVHADGHFAEELAIFSPGSANGTVRLNQEMLTSGKHFLHMNGKHVFMHAVTKMPAVLMEVCKKANVSLDEINRFFFHQANLRINEKISEDLKIPPQKIYNTIHKFGNTTAATIPLGMADALQNGQLKRGDLIALTAFGAGFTWGSAIIKY